MRRRLFDWAVAVVGVLLVVQEVVAPTGRGVVFACLFGGWLGSWVTEWAANRDHDATPPR